MSLLMLPAEGRRYVDRAQCADFRVGRCTVHEYRF